MLYFYFKVFFIFFIFLLSPLPDRYLRLVFVASDRYVKEVTRAVSFSISAYTTSMSGDVLM